LLFIKTLKQTDITQKENHIHTVSPFISTPRKATSPASITHIIKKVTIRVLIITKGITKVDIRTKATEIRAHILHILRVTLAKGFLIKDSIETTHTIADLEETHTIVDLEDHLGTNTHCLYSGYKHI